MYCRPLASWERDAWFVPLLVKFYGTALYVPIDEKHPLQGQSPYSATKIGADKLAESYYLSFGLPVAIARPFNTYGPRQSARAVIPTLITQALTGPGNTFGSLATNPRLQLRRGYGRRVHRNRRQRAGDWPSYQFWHGSGNQHRRSCHHGRRSARQRTELGCRGTAGPPFEQRGRQALRRRGKSP